ncbi:hypothetical protein [Croceiramulus getboli]|nr:hypothetical protein P8624_01730 [Flavobacteriaceae bacterium YJPT1-3]
MAPIKFEENMKEKLEGRSIKPSNSAWEKLSAGLDAHQQKSKQGKRVLWYAIAAAAAVVLLMALLISKPTVSRVPELTQEEPIRKEQQERSQSIPELVNEEELVQKSEPVNQEPLPTEKSTLPVDPQANQVQEAVVYEEKTILNSTRKRLEETNVVEENESEQKAISSSIQEVIAQVDALEQEQGTVTEEEIENLLKAAQQRLLQQQNQRYDYSAEELLAGVEMELGTYDKEGLFEMLKEGFFKMRDAVATRNN